MDNKILWTESLGGMHPICPACGHHNAMLGPDRSPSSGRWDIYTCRDCAYQCEAADVQLIR